MKTFENIKTFKTFINKIDEDIEFTKETRAKRLRKKEIVTIPNWGIY